MSSIFLPGKSHGQRSLVGCSPWGRKESDTTERLHFHFSLSCIGEGNDNPLQCSCLENLRDGGAWWAAVYRVAQSQTWLKWLSSSSMGNELENKWSFIFLYDTYIYECVCLRALKKKNKEENTSCFIYFLHFVNIPIKRNCPWQKFLTVFL